MRGALGARTAGPRPQPARPVPLPWSLNWPVPWFPGCEGREQAAPAVNNSEHTECVQRVGQAGSVSVSASFQKQVPGWGRVRGAFTGAPGPGAEGEEPGGRAGWGALVPQGRRLDPSGRGGREAGRQLGGRPCSVAAIKPGPTQRTLCSREWAWRVALGGGHRGQRGPGQPRWTSELGRGPGASLLATVTPVQAPAASVAVSSLTCLLLDRLADPAAEQTSSVRSRATNSADFDGGPIVAAAATGSVARDGDSWHPGARARCRVDGVEGASQGD